MFARNDLPILTFRVYDGYGVCISEYTGTLPEWQEQVARNLPLVSESRRERPRTLN